MDKKQSKTELCIDTRISDLGDNKYYLSAGWDEEKGIYYFPSLEFQNVQDTEYPSFKESWDNPYYLLNTLYDTLQEYLEVGDETLEFHNIVKIIPVEDFQVVFDILNQGIKMGFFLNINEYE